MSNTAVLSEKVLKKRALSIWNSEIFLSNYAFQLSGVFANGFVMSAYLVEVLNATPAFVGIMASFVMLPHTVLPITSLIINKLKRKKKVTAICLLGGRLLFLFSLVYGFIASRNGASTAATQSIMVVLCFIACSISSFTPAVNSWLSDILPDNQRSQKLALRNILINMGAVGGILTASVLLKQFEVDVAFPIIFVVGFISFIASAIILLKVYEPVTQDEVSIDSKAMIKESLADKNFLAFLFVVTLSTLAVFILTPFFIIFYLEYFNAPYDIIGYMSAGTMLTLVLGVFFFGRFMSVLGARLVTKITMAFLAILPLAWFFVPKDNYMVFMILLALTYSFIQGGWTISITSSGFSMTDKDKSLMYISIYSAVYALCQVVAPIIGGIVADMYSSSDYIENYLQLGHPIMILFIISCLLHFTCIMIFPAYKVQRETSNLRLRHLLFRTDFALVFSRLGNAAFMPYYLSNRKKLAQNMGGIKNITALQPLVTLLNDLDQDVRLEAIESIGNIPSEKSTEILLEFYKEANLIEQHGIIKAFGNFNDVETEDILLDMYKSDFTYAKAQAAYSLAKRKSERATELAADYIATAKNDEYQFLWHFSILATNKAVEILPIIIPHYKKMETTKHKEYTLYYIAVILGANREFYKVRNLEGEHNVQKYIKRMIDEIKEYKKYQEDIEFRNAIKAMQKELNIKARREEPISFAPYKHLIVVILESKIIKEIFEIITYFLDQDELTISEIEFTTLSIKTLIKTKRENLIKRMYFLKKIVPKKHDKK